MSDSRLRALIAAVRGNTVTVAIGARGSGKTFLARGLASAEAERGRDVVTMHVRDTTAPGDLSGEVAEALNCDASLLTVREYNGPGLTVIVDGFERLAQASGIDAFQDNWRACFADPANGQGHARLLVLGRPIARRVLGGRGSPLGNVARWMTIGPLGQEAISKEFSSEPWMIGVARDQTGGHPGLLDRLFRAPPAAATEVEATVAAFEEEHRHYINRLVRDHGPTGLATLKTLATSRKPVARGALLATREVGDRLAAADELDDLVASGLARRDAAGNLSFGASLARGAVRRSTPTERTDIPVEPGTRFLEGADLLFRIENGLRRFVADALEVVDEDWWQTRVPSDIADAAAGRAVDEDQSVAAYPTRTVHPIMYVELGDLGTIITGRANWDAVFAVRVGRGKGTLEALLGELGHLRRKIAHTRPFEDRDLEALRRLRRELPGQSLND